MGFRELGLGDDLWPDRLRGKGSASTHQTRSFLTSSGNTPKYLGLMVVTGFLPYLVSDCKGFVLHGRSILAQDSGLVLRRAPYSF